MGDFGAFVEIEKGVGLVHISQISRRHNDVSKVLKKGDEIRARILEADPEKTHKIKHQSTEEEEKKKNSKESKTNKENKDNSVKETEEAMVTIGMSKDQLSFKPFLRQNVCYNQNKEVNKEAL